MNSSQYMDKQIMDLSRSQTNNNNDLYDLLNPQEEQQYNGGGVVPEKKKKELKEEILPNYDFQPIRPLGTAGSHADGSGSVGGTRVWNSADSKHNTSTRNFSNLDPNGSARFTQSKEPYVYDEGMLSEIDQTMKKHADNLLHALEGVSARLSQMETRTRNLENLVDDLKLSVDNSHGRADGKMRQLENILREVQTGVQVMRDKQEIAEAQMQLAKLQVSKAEPKFENQNSSAYSDPVQQPASAPQQSTPHHPPPPQVGLPQLPQQVPGLSPPNVPPPPIQQNPPPLQLSTQAQLPQNQIPSNLQRDSYFPQPGQLPESTHQHYQVPPAPQLQMPPPPPPQPQHYQSAPQYPPSSQQPLQHQNVGNPNPPTPPPQLQPQASHYPDEGPHLPSQSYGQGIRQSSSANQPPTGGGPPQQFYGAPAHMYEPQSSRPNSGFSAGYGPSSAPNYNDSYTYSGSPRYGSSNMKPPQLSSTPSTPSAPSGGGSSYPRLPTAQILPQALPTAASVGSGSNSGGTGNRVPIDDVVDKVSTMGFSREQVRGTVRRLTENGQSVDLNVVLDTLMNDSEVQQPQKGWFGR